MEAALEAVRLGVDIVMCDNMSPEEISAVVEFKNTTDTNVLLECSGNIDDSNFKKYAVTGIDAISIGGIIHQAVWLDFSMKGGF